MTLETPDAYRISVVYYSLRGMKDCFTYAVESAEGAARRTAREDGIADTLKGERESAFQPWAWGTRTGCHPGSTGSGLDAGPGARSPRRSASDVSGSGRSRSSRGSW